jgi:bifunctional non-homologous end joining protein LigD
MAFGRGVRLVSRNGNTFKSFPGLCGGLDRDLKSHRCVLDGEIVCLDSLGRPQFRDLLFRRAEPLFYAFDILWDEHAWTDDEEEMRRFRNGEDLRYLPLVDRKLRLHAVVPKRGERLLYCDHIDGDGEGLFRFACDHDLEGVVAKRKSHTCMSMQHGSKFAIKSIGLVARSYSSASAAAILIFRCGMDARLPANQLSKTSTQTVSSLFRTPNSSQRGMFEPST